MGASQWGLGYEWHQLAADRPIKEFNERFLQLTTALGIEDTELAKGMYHAKMPTVIHRVIRVLEKDKTLKQLMHVAEDEVRAHLVSRNSLVMDIDAVGYGGFITAKTNKTTTNKGITIAGASKNQDKNTDGTVTTTPKWAPCSGFEAMVGRVVAKSGISESVVWQRADSGVCLLCGDKAHKMSACPSDKGKAQ
ncbi:hypothetical protein H4R27_004254 [Coemansia aciculifera]|nr:hypothetical protein H4R27_004254 [Coemansia aciculifera]